MTEPFICDGMCCVVRDECARYMGNVDIDRLDAGLVHNAKPWLVCPHYIQYPDSEYPQIRKREDGDSDT